MPCMWKQLRCDNWFAKTRKVETPNIRGHLQEMQESVPHNGSQRWTVEKDLSLCGLHHGVHDRKYVL